MSHLKQIVGPPGTGKTTALSHAAREAASKFGPERVLITSLTKAAAFEIGARDTGIPKENIGTMHSLAMRAAELQGKTILDSPAGLKLWNAWIGPRYPGFEIESGFDPDDPLSGAGGFGGTYLSRMNIMRHKMIPHEMWPDKLIEFGNFWKECQDDLDAIDFTGMIEAGFDLDCPGNPKVLIGDEYQDWSKLEVELFKHWATQADESIVAGDEDQCIYGFRGADPDALKGLANEVEVLPKSWRVPSAIHGYSQRLVNWIPGRTRADYLPRVTGGDGWLNREMRWKFPQRWINLVLRALKPGDSDPLPATRAMVLAPCAFYLSPFLSLCRKNGIPYGNPYRPRRGDWNPLRSGEKSASSQLLAFLGGDWNTWTVDQLKTWIPVLAGPKVKGEADPGRYAVGWGVKARLAKQASQDGQRPTQAELAALWTAPEHLHRALNRDVDWLTQFMSEKDHKRLAFPIAVWRRHGAEALRTVPKLTVGTVHSVKGGEAEHVFLITALPGRWNRDSDKAALARLAYVGVTRARETVTLLCGDPGGIQL